MDGVGELVVRATVWLAMLGYLAGAIDACAPGLWGERGSRFARNAWTAGAIIFLIHVASAFHVFYGWSHQVAWQETARQTAEATGRSTGFGLWLNYLFTAIWAVDAGWWWANPTGYRARNRLGVAAVHLFLFFMVFNGSVVFGRGPVRIFGSLICLVLVAAVVARWRRRSHEIR